MTVGDVSIGRTEYRFRGDTSRVAFTESTFRLTTDTNSPSVTRSMVDVAEARNWRALRVSGSEDFKRMVWLEASVRGVKTVGSEAQPGDLELLKRQREARLINRIEPARDTTGNATSATTEKASGRGSGRKAVLIEAVLVAKRVPELQRAAVMAAATDKLAQRIRDGRHPGSRSTTRRRRRSDRSSYRHARNAALARVGRAGALSANAPVDTWPRASRRRPRSTKSVAGASRLDRRAFPRPS